MLFNLDALLLKKMPFYAEIVEETELVGPNGHVGHRADGFEEIHGGFGVWTQNNGGRRLLEYCAEANLVVMNIWFKKANKVTLRSAGVETETDFMLVQHSWRKKIRNVNVIPGELQHSLVVMNVNSWGEEK